MEEENKSITSNPVLLSNIQESSDSDAASSMHPPAKRCRLEQQYTSFPSPFFQGIILQHTGRWAAPTHADSHRLRPGTIEVDAVVSMTGDRSCNKSKPVEYLRIAGGEACVGEVSVPGHERVVFQELFRKELTPSDVGKLNRLVIPKKQAERHFPRIVQGVGGGGGRRWGGGHGGDGSTEGMMLEFKDAEGRPWEFRYCYWRSSQSFVFTKGWNRFIRTKGLRQGDVVVFYRCEDKHGRRKPFCMIDVRHGAGGRDDSDEPVCALGSAGHGEEEGEVGLGIGLGGGKGFPESGSMEQVRTREPGKEVDEEGESSLLERPVGVCKGRKSIMLFGVEIASS